MCISLKRGTLTFSHKIIYQIDSSCVFISFVEVSLNVVAFNTSHINPESFIIPQCLVPKDQFELIKERENMSLSYEHILSFEVL